jgi:hypothetical protein
VLDRRPLGQGQIIEQRRRVARERTGLGRRTPPAAPAVIGTLYVVGLGCGVEAIVGRTARTIRTVRTVSTRGRRRTDPLVRIVEEPAVANG